MTKGHTDGQTEMTNDDDGGSRALKRKKKIWEPTEHTTMEDRQMNTL